MKRFIILAAACFLAATGFAQPQARHHEAVALDRKTNVLAVFGGAEMSGSNMAITNTTWIYDGAWKMVADAGITPRWGSGLNFHQRKLYAYGGLAWDSSKNETLLNDLYIMENNKWKYLTHGPLLEQPQLVSLRNTLWLIGRSTTNKQQVEVWRFDAVDRTFVQADQVTLNNNSNFYACGDMYGNLVVVYGKDSGIVVNNLSDASKSFEVTLSKSISKYSITYNEEEDAFFLFGGLDEDRVDVTDLWKIKSGMAEMLSFASGPAARSSAHLVSPKGGILLYGGVQGGKMTNDLWQYSGGEWKEKK